ncbi:MAG: CBM21 domain-containing protein [Clostridia bacterium]|nr:CBM21 domain-containing protein [Clostridia bacterium]
MNNQKSISRIVAVMIVLCISLMSGAGAFTQTAQAATNPVKLYYAKFKDASSTKFSIYGYIQVENLAYNKSVVVCYTNGDGVWKEVAAKYTAPASGNYERWYFETSAAAASTFQFAVKYVVNGQTYWDNNNGSNYSLSYYSANRAALGESNVVLGNANKDNYGLHGNIYLKNIASTKVVKVRYTTDNWVTWNEVNASYLSTAEGGIEVWNFDVYKPTSTTQATFKFAISYTVNGVTYWDNNFGLNYTV